MHTEISSFTLFGHNDSTELEKLKAILEVSTIRILLTRSSHLSYDLARLIEIFNESTYAYWIHHKKDKNDNDIIYIDVEKIEVEE